MYFSLKNHCFLNNNVVYDLIYDKCYELNNNFLDILKDFQNKNNTEYISNIYGHNSFEEFKSFFIGNNLGDFYESTIHIDPITSYGQARLELNNILPLYLDQVVVELTGDCNLNCEFCKIDNVIYRSCGCKKWENKSLLTDEKWLDISKQIVKLNPRSVIFSGGEPFLRKDLLVKMVDYFSINNINSIIYTNGLLLDEDLSKFLVAKNSTIVVQVYSMYEDTYSLITQNSGNILNLKNNILRFKDLKGNLIANILVCKQNEDEIFEFERYLKENFIYSQRCYLFPSNESYSKKFYNDSISKDNKINIPINYQNYNYNLKFNLCLSNNIFISSEGNVHPCMMFRDFNFGNLKYKQLYEVFRNHRYREFWELSKSKIKNCRECGYNIKCQDCRALQYYVTKDINGISYCSEINLEKEVVLID